MLKSLPLLIKVFEFLNSDEGKAIIKEVKELIAAFQQAQGKGKIPDLQELGGLLKAQAESTDQSETA